MKSSSQTAPIAPKDICEVFEAMGYQQVRVLPDGRVIGLMSFLFTVGLVVDLTSEGYHHRYCYPDHQSGAAAIAIWDGTGDPPGPWIKRKGPDASYSNPLRFKGVEIALDAGTPASRDGTGP